MTDEQSAAQKEIHRLADENSILIPTMWVANDVYEHFNFGTDDPKNITMEKAEDMLFDWKRQLEEKATEGGWEIIYDMMDENDDDDD